MGIPERLTAFIKGADGIRIAWCVFLLVGVLISITGIVILVTRKRRKEIHYALAAGVEFLACWILYIPEELFGEQNVKGLLQIAEGILIALIKNFNVYFGDGYEKAVYAGHPTFTSIYGILRALVNLTLCLFVGGFVLKFMDGPMQSLKLWKNRRRYVYLFSKCNEKTLALAKSITGPAKGKKSIVFACDEKTEDPGIKERIREIGGILVERSVADLVNRYRKTAAGMEIFLFEKEEEGNLTQLDTICTGLKNYGGKQIKIYVELLDTPWDLYDNFLEKYQINTDGRENVIVNFVRAEENFVYNNLLRYSVFEHAKPVEGEAYREIRALIVGGMNARNLEMFKALLHLCQMPGYRLKLMILEDGEGICRRKQLMPEVEDTCQTEGDAFYTILHKEKIDYRSDAFEKTIREEFPDFTFAFINAGDDLLNMNLAILLNALCIREQYTGYRIQVNMEHQEICDKWNPQMLENLETVGDLAKTYAYGFITMSDIEAGTIAIHQVRYGKSKSWTSYCNNEYNRHSVYARTLSFKYKVDLIRAFYGGNYSITGEEGSVWKVYEHMRWNMYTRTLGYRVCPDRLSASDGKPDKKTRSVAKVHEDLILFKDLSPDEQRKDALVLTTDIVDILTSIPKQVER